MARNVLVSGGAGALGRAVVEAFLEGGDHVMVPWIVEAERDALAAALCRPLEAGSLTLLAADVAEADGAAAAVEAAEPVTVLVNGAGGFAGGMPHTETPLEDFDRMYRINLRTAAALCQAALPGMTSRAAGCIVNVASRAAIDRPPTLAAYSASKAGVLVLTETLQKEVAEHGVRVNAVVPTTIDTPANRAAMPDADFGAWTPTAAIAAVVHWLASDAAASVRGGAIPV